MSDIDITADLTDGSFDAGTVPNAQPGQSGDSVMQTPPGTEPTHGARVQNPSADSLAASSADKPVPSVRELLSSAFKGADGLPTNQQAAAPAGNAPALIKDEKGTYRNSDGTYADAAQIAAFESAANAPAATDPFAPVLASFTPAEQELFKAAPPELQQLVGRTMDAMNVQRQRYGEYDMLEQHLLAPRRQAWANAGSNPVAAINQLFAVSDFAGRDPAAFVLWYADQQKLDLDAILDARDAQQAQAGTVHPQVQQLTQTVQQLQQYVAGVNQEKTQAVLDNNLNDFRTFALEKDTQGNLRRPYMTEVSGTIAQHVQSVRQANPQMPNAEVLQKAYENACWTDPTVRAKMQDAANVATRAQTAEAARKARQAGSSVGGGPAGSESTVPNNGARSVRDELKAQFAAHGA